MIYLDYNASAPICQEAMDAVISALKNETGNADSRTHTFGMHAQQTVTKARENVAALFGVKPRQVIFTSGATESNNMVFHGIRNRAARLGRPHVVISSIEHKSVLETALHLRQEGYEVTVLDPGEDGRISFEQLKEAVRENTVLVSLMHVNNETGMIQPVEMVGQWLKDSNILFHVDATQSAGKLVPELQNLNYDLLSFSSHKLQGPQGIGGLIIKNHKDFLKEFEPLMYGGHQEQGLRPGTTPIALTAGLGAAAQRALLHWREDREKAKNLKQIVIEEIEKSGVNFKINGNQKFCVDTTLNISFKGVSSEALMIMLKNECAISNGSACTSNDYALSYVLQAMNLPEEQVEEAVRISWGPDTDAEELRKSIIYMCEIVKQFC